MSADSPFGPPARPGPQPPPPSPSFVDRRAPTSTQDVESAAPGTMVTVPKVEPSGGVGLPDHVAVPTVNKFADPTFLLTAGGALLVLVDPVVTLLKSTGPIDWRGFAAACILALAAWFRQHTNTVTK